MVFMMKKNMSEKSCASDTAAGNPDRQAYMPTHPRMRRELKTVAVMIDLYCHAHHGTGTVPCDECRDLLNYARMRLENCPFQGRKTTCGNCSIHCYRKANRQKIREVMKYAGPRMAWHHPLLALGHMFDGFRKKPAPAPHAKKKRKVASASGSGYDRPAARTDGKQRTTDPRLPPRSA